MFTVVLIEDDTIRGLFNIAFYLFGRIKSTMMYRMRAKWNYFIICFATQLHVQQSILYTMYNRYHNQISWSI